MENLIKSCRLEKLICSVDVDELFESGGRIFSMNEIFTRANKPFQLSKIQLVEFIDYGYCWLMIRRDVILFEVFVYMSTVEKS